MRHFITLFLHELRMLLIAPATYAAAVIFLLLMSIFYILGLRGASLGLNERLPTQEFFQLFVVPVFFMVPLLTMRSIAEERRLGTLETLMTTPVTAFETVFGKFLSAYFFYMLLWSLTLAFPFLVTSFHPSAQLDPYLLDAPSLIGGYSFIALSGLLYIAIGLFASSLTRSQLVAGMLSFSMLFLVVMSGWWLFSSNQFKTEEVSLVRDLVDYFNTFKHLEDFTRGIIDTRPFVFYITACLLGLGITTLVVESKV